MRQLRDRLAEAIRRCRIGSVQRFDTLPEETREEYRQSADDLMKIGRLELGFLVMDNGAKQ